MFAPKFDGNKVKVQLKMLVNRFNLQTQKRTNLAKQQKRQVAMLLRDDKEANAKILVEHIIREDYTLESFEVLKQHTELLTARLNVMVTEAELKPEIADAVCALLYAGYLMGSEIPELKQLNILFTAKYGKTYAQEVIAHKERYLDQRLLRMLTSTQVPDPSVVSLYLAEIAKAYGVEWTERPVSTPTAPLSSIGGVPLPMPGMPIPGAVPAGVSAADFEQPVTPAPAIPQATATHVPVAHVPINVVPVQPYAPAPGNHAAPSSGTVPITVVLNKGPAGFGMTLDATNTITAFKPGSEAEASGQLRVGDRVISLNGIPVHESNPVKTVAIDLPDGPATFLVFRGTLPAQPSTQLGAPVAPGEASAVYQGTVAPPAAPPVATHTFSYPPLADPELEAMPPAPVAGAPIAHATPWNSGASTPALPPPNDEEDELAKRLEMLKRG